MTSQFTSTYPTGGERGEHSTLDAQNTDKSQSHSGSAMICVHQLFEIQAAKTPDAVALCDGETTVTYQELNQRANQVAHALRAQGIGANSLVAVHLERSVDLIVSFLGTLKAGAAYVPIDPAYPADRRAFMLENSQAPVLLTHSSLLDTLPGRLPEYKGCCICFDRDRNLITQQPTENLSITPDADHLAYMIYTSGSTGVPKGVLIPHRGLSNHAQAMAQIFQLRECDRILQFSSISFDVILEELYPSLISGTAVVLRPDNIIYSIQAFLQYVEQQRITVLNIPTAFWHELVRDLERLNCQLPPRVRLVVVGGEQASRAAYARWRSLIGNQVRWLNAYGPTETTVSATLFDPLAADFDYETEEIPIGVALPNVETYVLDDNLQPVPPMQPGELYIGGAGLAVGYHNLPEKTAERFIPSPFASGQRLYKTGDSVRQRPDGHLEYLGRMDFCVKIRGFRIELMEIETCLGRHPQVAQQVVTVHIDPTGNQRLIAYVVPQAESSLDIQDLRNFVATALPDYMVPSSFVILEELPITTNGKVDRQRLSTSLLTQDRHDVVLPKTDLEAALIPLWQEILGVSPIGVTDNFFELGGHSLLVARFFGELELQLGYRAPLMLLLESPTIREFSTRLAAEHIAERNEQNPLVVPLKSGQTNPPLFLIHDADGDTSLYLNLAAQMEGDRAIYGIQARRHQGIPVAHPSFEAMAADYRQQIQAVQPHGPYLLGGLCAGGVLAFEIALQLQSLGETVALVALLESPDVAAVLRPKLKQSQFRDNLNATFQSSQNRIIGGYQALRFVAQRLKARLSERLAHELEQTKAKLLQKFYARDQQAVPRILYGVSVRTLYLLAEANYQPETRFDGSVVLIKATSGEGPDQPYSEVYRDRDFGWRDRTTQDVQVFTVPGGHSTMLSADYVSTIITILQQAIDQVCPHEPTS